MSPQPCSGRRSMLPARTYVTCAFYQQLCQAGKAKNLALTAGMRNLLPILTMMVKMRSPWRKSVGQPA